MARNVQIPDGWRLVRLGEVLKLEYGVSLPERRRSPGHIPVVGSAGLVGFHSQCTVRGPGVVVGRKGTIGSVTWVAGDFVPIDTTYFMVPIDEQLDLRWTYHFLTRENLSRLNRATGVPGLNRDDVYAIRRLVPPLSEQRAIAAVLDSIDEAIERTEAVIAATEQLRESLLHELLTRGVPGWHSEWKEVRGIGTIPADWDVVRLGDVATVRNGTTPSRANPNYWNNGSVPFVKTGRVNDVFIDESDEFITSEAVTSAGAVVVPEGSVLIAMIGQGKTRGMTARLGFRAAINQNFAAVHNPQAGLNLEFFFAWSRHNYSFIRNLGQGSNQDALNCELIQRMRIPKPTDVEQHAIAGLDDCMNDATDRARQELRGLQSLKASAADALLTGRVRID